MNRVCLVIAIVVAVMVSIGCDNPAEPEPWPDGAYFYVGSNFPDTALSWSPYGSILLFTAFSFNSNALHGFDGIENPVAITSSGMNESTGPNGCWNGENGLIAYTAWSGDSASHVRTMPGNVGAISIVLNNGMLHHHPSWDPEGNILAVSDMKP